MEREAGHAALAALADEVERHVEARAVDGQIAPNHGRVRRAGAEQSGSRQRAIGNRRRRALGAQFGEVHGARAAIDEGDVERRVGGRRASDAQDVQAAAGAQGQRGGDGHLEEARREGQHKRCASGKGRAAHDGVACVLFSTSASASVRERCSGSACAVRGTGACAALCAALARKSCPHASRFCCGQTSHWLRRGSK